MAIYHVRNRRVSPGCYELSYGRGSRKIVAGLRIGEDGLWRVDEGAPGCTTTPSKKQGDVKDAWGRWAESQYASVQVESPDDVQGTTGNPGDETVKTQSTIDPQDALDPDLHHTKGDRRGKLTPLGVLDDVYYWMVRQPHRCLSPEGELQYPWSNVLAVLRREMPDRSYPDIVPK